MDTGLKLHIGQQIRAARRAKGLTQEDLATRTDRTPESISNLERGKTKPNLDTLIALAEVLDLSLHDFFTPTEGAKTTSERRTRLEIEMEGRELLKTLSDKHLPIAIRQLAALLYE